MAYVDPRKVRKTWYVYALMDPRDDSVRYIGISTRVYARLVQHHANRFENKEKHQWLKELDSLDLEPTIAILETIPRCMHYEATISESEWIKRFLPRGTLFNKTYRKVAPKGLAKLWEDLKEVPKSPIKLQLRNP